MDAELRIETAPFRDPRYAPRRLEVENRADGTIVLTNPTPFSTDFATVMEPIAHWARLAPDRVWLAERPAEGAEGWRTLTYAEARAKIGAIAGGLKALGLTGPAPLLILARNGTID